MKTANIFKIIITLPYFLWGLRKISKWYKRTIKDPNVIKEEKRYKWVKKISKYVLWLHNTKIKVCGLKNWIDGGVLITPNHESNADPLIMLYLNNFSYTAPCSFVAKIELKKSKLVYRFMSLIDSVFIDRKNLRQTAKAITEAKDLIKVPRSMILFPEGTRNAANEVKEFKAGAFKIAQKAYCPVVPVTIYDSYKILSGKKLSKKEVIIIFHKPLEPMKILNSNTSLLSEVVHRTVQSGIDNINEYKKTAVSLKKATRQLSSKPKADFETKLNLFKKNKQN